MWLHECPGFGALPPDVYQGVTFPTALQTGWGAWGKFCKAIRCPIPIWEVFIGILLSQDIRRIFYYRGPNFIPDNLVQGFPLVFSPFFYILEFCWASGVSRSYKVGDQTPWMGVNGKTTIFKWGTFIISDSLCSDGSGYFCSALFAHNGMFPCGAFSTAV